MPTRRARTSPARRARRRAILTATLEALEEADAADVTMADVAARVDLAKGTLYLYFPRREELLLEALGELLAEWLSALEALLAPLEEGDAAPGSLAAQIARSALNRRVLRQILPRMHALESAAGGEATIVFRQRLRAQLLPPAAHLERLVPRARPGDGTRMMLWIIALIAGFHPHVDPTRTVARALARPDLRVFRLDLERELSAAIRGWLTAWRAP